MAGFKKSLETIQGIIILNFTRIYTVSGTIYFTMAVGKNVRFSFQMERRNGEWKAMNSPPPPGWFLLHEDEVGKMLDEHEAA